MLELKLSKAKALGWKELLERLAGVQYRLNYDGVYLYNYHSSSCQSLDISTRSDAGPVTLFVIKTSKGKHPVLLSHYLESEEDLDKIYVSVNKVLETIEFFMIKEEAKQKIAIRNLLGLDE